MSKYDDYELIHFTSVRLPYKYNALEPYIDEETMQIHYNKHYLGYLRKFNDLVDKYDINDNVINIMQNIEQYPIEVRDNGGGYVNHSMFWKMLKPNPKKSSNTPYGLSLNKIIEDFDTYGQFKETILEASSKRFGSGWLWWVMNKDGSTNILATPYQDNPYMSDYGSYPLLGIDVWEHAYYLKYDADRTKYVKNIFNIINWEEVNRRIAIANRMIRDIRIIN
jgi:superoxide dismutase, Fe-Mn family